MPALGARQLSDARSARALGSEITQAGIAVYDALQQEPELQDARQRYHDPYFSFSCCQLAAAWLNT